MPPELSVLTDPDAFFRERSDDPSLLWPAAIVLVIGLIGLVSGFIQTQAMSDLMQFEGPGAGIASAFQTIGLIIGLIGAFVVWLLYSGVFHAISVVFDGEGDFSTTLSLVGYGYVPQVFSGIVSALITYYRFNVVGYTTPDEMTAEAFQEFSQEVSTGPLVALDGGLGLLFTLWSAFLWVFAMKYARDLETRDAAITVAVPVLISAALSVWGIVTGLGLL